MKSTKTMGAKTGMSLLVAFSMLFAGGCATSMKSAKRTAVVSQTVYNAVKAQVVDQIAEIIEKDDRGLAGPEDRRRLRMLDGLRKLLDKYSEAHNAYVGALRIWDKIGEKPAQLLTQEHKVLELWFEVSQMASQLGIMSHANGVTRT